MVILREGILREKIIKMDLFLFWGGGVVVVVFFLSLPPSPFLSSWHFSWRTLV